ncbi:TPA: hypothetical protein ACVU5Q_004460 [Vibrio parahaemolyticus]|jgi:hypothetical protein
MKYLPVLERGRSINQTAEFTGKGRSTIKRVKAAMSNLCFVSGRNNKAPNEL